MFELRRFSLQRTETDLAWFNRVEKRNYNKKWVIALGSDKRHHVNEARCARLCKENKTCNSFDYCEVEDLYEQDKTTYACYMHGEEPTRSTKNRNSELWEAKAVCHHYACKFDHNSHKHTVYYSSV